MKIKQYKLEDFIQREHGKKREKFYITDRGIFLELGHAVHSTWEIGDQLDRFYKDYDDFKGNQPEKVYLYCLPTRYTLTAIKVKGFEGHAYQITYMRPAKQFKPGNWEPVLELEHLNNGISQYDK